MIQTKALILHADKKSADSFKRVFFGALILCALSNFVVLNARAYSLVISEIMYDAPSPGSDTGREWVEIKNIGDSAVNIVSGSGAGSFRFYDGSNHYLNDPTMGSLNINPGEFLVVAQATSTFLTSYPTFSGNLTKSAINLNNTSATLKIIDGNGNTLDEVIYQNAWGGNGNGKSLSKINLAGDNNTPSNWQDSLQTGGTPGQENTFSNPSPSPSISPSPSTSPPVSPSALLSPSPSPTPSPSAIHSPSPSFVPSPSYSAPPSASLSPAPQITPAPSLAYPNYTYPSFPPIGGPSSSQGAIPSFKSPNTNNNESLLNVYGLKSGSSSSTNLSASQDKLSDKLENLFSSNNLFQKFSSLPKKTMFWGFVVAGVSAAAAFFLFLKI